MNDYTPLVGSEFDFQTVSADKNGQIFVLSATKVQNQQSKGTPLVIQEKARQVVHSNFIKVDCTQCSAVTEE